MKILGAGFAAVAFTAAASIAAAQDMDHSMMKMGMTDGCMQRMQQMDENGDGSVTKDEFMQAQEQMFTTMDRDGDGALGSQEAQGMMSSCCGRMDESGHSDMSRD